MSKLIEYEHYDAAQESTENCNDKRSLKNRASCHCREKVKRSAGESEMSLIRFADLDCFTLLFINVHNVQHKALFISRSKESTFTSIAYYCSQRDKS